MSEKGLIQKTTLEAIADKIRSKTGKTAKIPVAKEAFSSEIDAVYQKGVEDGMESSIPVLQEKTVIENGEYVPDDGYAGFSKFVVEVPDTTPKLQEKIITQNGEYTPGEDCDGFSKVTVAVEENSVVLTFSGSLILSEDGILGV